MYCRLFLFLFIIVSLPACATIEQPSSKNASIPLTSIQPSTGVIHIVQSGETLWRISKVYDIDLEYILKANGIHDSKNIMAGEKLIIPPSSSYDFSKGPVVLKEETDFMWPIHGKIITNFRQKRDGVSSKGIDILSEPAQDVLASRDGIITFVGELAGYGRMIIIDHRDGLSSVYCGVSSTQVKRGDEVKQGRAVAKTTKQSRQGYNCLHFQIRKNHKPQNPMYYLN